VIETDGAGGLRYRYGPAPPESVLARALHRFFDPRIVGHEPDELRAG
jgi:hypothetical protein